jgi:membrane protein implicated in regulation of membrane protease activity
MDFSVATFWWVAAGAVVAAELATGTFYLLMIALGLVGAALAAHLGLSLSLQVVTAALVGGGATALWHWRRTVSQPTPQPVAQNRDVNLDIGERVTVGAWEPDHTARVTYRGSSWKAKRQPGVPEVTGEHVVQAVEGNWLVVAPLTH